MTQITWKWKLLTMYVGESNEIETLLCAAVCTSGHQHQLEPCTVYGERGDVGFMTSAEHAKMATLLEACMEEEKRSVIHFLLSEGNKPIEIHHCMKLQYGKVCLSLQQVYKWNGKFKNGVSSVMDATQLGQAQRYKATGNCRG
jgi:hypothetical protein